MGVYVSERTQKHMEFWYVLQKESSGSVGHWGHINCAVGRVQKNIVAWGIPVSQF